MENTWTTKDEIDFIDNEIEGLTQYLGYKKGIQRRKRWGRIDKDRILKKLGLNGTI